MVSVCLPSDALLQHLRSYLGFSYLGHGVSLHGCSSKAQPLLLTLEEGYLLTISAGGCDHQRAKRGREEPPHVRGHGRKPGGPHARRVVANRSYHTSAVRGSCREYQTATAQERPRGATPRPHAGGQGRWPEGSTPRPRSRGCAGAGGPRYCVCYPVKHLSALKTLFHYDTFRSTWAKLQKSTLFSDLNAKKQHSVQFEQ